jgi:Na+-translocating ferredoxin:NAD+ oxidoreductase RnfG subunit
MHHFLKPTKLKIIVAVVVAIAAFFASEIASAAKDKIWQSVHPVITKEALMEEVSEERAVRFEELAQTVTEHVNVDWSNIESAVWKERAANLVIFLLIGYLASCLIVEVSRRSNEI